MELASASKHRAPGWARWGALSGLAAAAVFASIVLPASAAPAAADPTPTATTVPGNAQTAVSESQRLENRFQQEKQQLARQQQILTRAGNLATRIQDRIDALKGRGQDTSRLEAALSAFRAAIASAQESWNTAKNILDTHSGFDDAGKVTDATQARATLDSARQAMEQTRLTMARAAMEFREGIRDQSLSLRLTREQGELAGLQDRLGRVDERISSAQALIDRQKAAGKDTSTLETALSAFKDALTAVRSDLDKARAALDARTGFDAAGHVTDASQARTTVQTAHNSLSDAAHAFRKAVLDLTEAIQQFRSANKS